MTRAAVAIVATAATAFVVLPAGALGTAPLTVATGSPQDVGATAATLRATATAAATGGQVSWQYGTTTGYGATTATVEPTTIGAAQTLTVAVTDLAPGTTYHVRAVGTDGRSTSYGRDVTFTTDRAEDNSGSGSGSSGSSGSGSSGSGSGSAGDRPTTTTPTATTPATPATGADGATTRPSASTGSSETASGRANDGSGAATAPGVATADVAPVLGKTLAIAAVRGTVKATTPTGRPVDLSDAAAVPTGTLIDTRAGAVELKSALDTAGQTQVARFWGGLFEVRQNAGGHGLTQLVLRGGDFTSCGARSTVRRAGTATAARKRKPPRSLWGSDDHGRFQTRGRGSTATVRGTRWLTEDRCEGTFTRVTAGAVAVRDLRRARTVVVRKGHSYLARLAR